MELYIERINVSRNLMICLACVGHFKHGIETDLTSPADLGERGCDNVFRGLCAPQVHKAITPSSVPVGRRWGIFFLSLRTWEGPEWGAMIDPHSYWSSPFLSFSPLKFSSVFISPIFSLCRLPFLLVVPSVRLTTVSLRCLSLKRKWLLL